MSFVSFAFVALYALALLARLALGRSKFGRGYLGTLLAASVVFYGWHVPQYLLLILVSALVDYVAGLLLTRDSMSGGARRAVLSLSIAVNLGFLVIFKYANFFAELLAEALRGTGVSFPAQIVSAELPIGISFYTFQSMSYTIDVYRHHTDRESSFLRFFLFVSFFPQLVAGPIVRARDFLKQLPRRRQLRSRVMLEGAYLVVLGFFLKMVVADNLSGFVDELWPQAADPDHSGLFSLWVAVLFSCQIFADFAGYSSIARGVGYTLGFRLPVNFRAPYVAATFSDFWRRWHISLSGWLRDYLYLPLGGNRKGRTRTYANLFVVMLLGGLWHGAATTYVVWGCLHGLGLAVERLLGLNRMDGRIAWYLRLPWFIVVQAGVLFAWIVFRSDTMGEAAAIARNALRGGDVPWEVIRASSPFVLPIVILHIRTALADRSKRSLGGLEKAIISGVMAAIVLAVYGERRGFIYFQF